MEVTQLIILGWEKEVVGAIGAVAHGVGTSWWDMHRLGVHGVPSEVRVKVWEVAADLRLWVAWIKAYERGMGETEGMRRSGRQA